MLQLDEIKFRHITAGGPGSGRHAGLAALQHGRYAYERRAAEAVAKHPHLAKFINIEKSVAVAGPHGVWQTKHTGTREKAQALISKLSSKALALGYKASPSNTGSFKHESGAKVSFLPRTSVTPSGKAGTGVQVDFHVMPKK